MVWKCLFESSCVFKETKQQLHFHSPCHTKNWCQRYMYITMLIPSLTVSMMGSWTEVVRLQKQHFKLCSLKLGIYDRRILLRLHLTKCSLNNKIDKCIAWNLNTFSWNTALQLDPKCLCSSHSTAEKINEKYAIHVLISHAVQYSSR